MSDRPRQKWFLREWRKHRGLTIEKLADILDKSKGYLSHLERGEKRYNQDLLEELSAALGCDPADLLCRDPADEDPIWMVWNSIPTERRELALQVLKTFAEPDDHHKRGGRS